MSFEILIKDGLNDSDSRILNSAIAGQQHGVKRYYLSVLASGYYILYILPLSASYYDSIVKHILELFQAIQNKRVTIVTG